MESKHTSKNCVIYARQSFGQEEGSASIEVQVSKCREWAQAHGVAVAGVFSDSNTSSELYPATAEGMEACRVDRGFQRWAREQKTKGRKQYKEGLGRAFDCISAIHPTYIVAYTANRLGRSATNSNLNNFMTAFFMEHGCSVVDVMAGSITDFSDRLMLAFRQMKDALDYQGLAEKRIASMQAIDRRINSHRVWSNAFGVVMDGGQVTFDADRAEVVRHIFDAVVCGTPYNQILKSINARWQHLFSGRQCYPSTLVNILSNIVYTGYSRDRAGVVARAANCPNPIVSYSKWMEANRLRQTRKKAYGTYNVRGSERVHWLPLSGYIYCHCGRRMQMALDRGRILYKCFCAGDHRNSIYIHATDKATDLLEAVRALLIINVLASRHELALMQEATSRIDAIKAAIGREEKEMQAKFRLVTDDDTLAMFRPAIDEGRERIKGLRAELCAEEAKQAQGADDLRREMEEDFAAVMDGHITHEAYQRLLRRTLDRMVVEADKVTFRLTDGNSFSLPRIMVDGRGTKTLPKATVYAQAGDPADIQSLCHYDIIYGEGEDRTLLVASDDYNIWLAR